MPFKSQAQAGYLHSHPEILGKKGLAEWDAATKGKKLPKKVRGGNSLLPANHPKAKSLIEGRKDNLASKCEFVHGV